VKLIPFTAAALIASTLLAADKGLPARSNPADYSARADDADFTIAAQVLDDDEVQSGFATDLYRKYAVVEVAVYPAKGKTLDVADVDFAVKYDGKSALTRPASPRTIAASLQRRAANKKDPVTLYPNVGFGVGTGPYGTSTGTNVGVGVGVGENRPQPASSPADRDVMQTELEEKALPSGPAAKPIAGYLYFPLPARKKVVVEELSFERDGKTIRVPLKPSGASH
jgi:hypothetical protein